MGIAYSDQTSTRLAEIKEEIRELQMLRRTAADVLRLHRECEDITRDIAKLEAELSATGSTATTEEIQAQLTQLSEQMWVFISGRRHILCSSY